MKTSGFSFPFSVLLIVGAAAATLSTGLVLGVLILPAPEPDHVEAAELPAPETLPNGSRAMVLVTGDREERFVSQQVTAVEFNEDTEEGDPIELNLRFSGSGVSLLIRTNGGITIDDPATDDRARVVFSMGADTFYSLPGDCTIELRSIEYVTIGEPGTAPLSFRGAPHHVPIPHYTASVACDALEALQSGITISLEAVFRYDEKNDQLDIGSA
jgi:hypothetical protein